MSIQSQTHDKRETKPRQTIKNMHIKYCTLNTILFLLAPISLFQTTLKFLEQLLTVIWPWIDTSTLSVNLPLITFRPCTTSAPPSLMNQRNIVAECFCVRWHSATSACPESYRLITASTINWPYSPTRFFILGNQVISLLNRYDPLGSLRPSNSGLLATPFVRTSFGARGFIATAHKVWNATIRNSPFTWSYRGHSQNLLLPPGPQFRIAALTTVALILRFADYVHSNL